jgi:hypothetical protein
MLVVVRPRLGTAYRSHLPETSAKYYKHTVRNILENERPQAENFIRDIWDDSDFLSDTYMLKASPILSSIR